MKNDNRKKNTDVVLAQMDEKKSKHGNTYFEGRYEAGGRLIMRRVTNEIGNKAWMLFVTK